MRLCLQRMTKWHNFPFLVVDNIRNNSSPTTELESEFGILNSCFGFKFSNFIHNSPRKFNAKILASGMIAASFSLLVQHVVFKGALKKMVWIDARRIVALVKNAMFWFMPFMQEPRCAVSTNPFCRTPPNSNSSISPAESCTNPNPTRPQVRNMFWNRTIFINVLPKAFSECVREPLRKCRMLLKCNWHNQVVFGLPAPPHCLPQCGGASFIPQPIQ